MLDRTFRPTRAIGEGDPSSNRLARQEERDASLQQCHGCNTCLQTLHQLHQEPIPPRRSVQSRGGAPSPTTSIVGGPVGAHYRIGTASLDAGHDRPAIISSTSFHGDITAAKDPRSPCHRHSSYSPVLSWRAILYTGDVILMSPSGEPLLIPGRTTRMFNQLGGLLLSRIVMAPRTTGDGTGGG